MSTLQKQREGLCRRLRSKGMYVEAEPDPAVPEAGDGFFWCTHTMNCLGPDAGVADDQRCRAPRRCYEPA